MPCKLSTTVNKISSIPNETYRQNGTDPCILGAGREKKVLDHCKHTAHLLFYPIFTTFAQCLSNTSSIWYCFDDASIHVALYL